MTCKDCIHDDVCEYKKIFCEKFDRLFDFIDIETECKHFKDKSRIIELPCGVGDTFYAIVNGQIIAYNCVGFKYGHSAFTEKNNELLLLTVYDMEFEFGEEAFLSNEEAEAKIKELNHGKD